MNFTKLLRDLVGCGSGILLFLLIFSWSVFAQTEVEGEVSGIWIAQNSPYILTDLTVINSDDTLIVEPGVTIEFSDVGSLLLNGTAILRGTEEDSIRFIGENTNQFIMNRLDRPEGAIFIADYLSSNFFDHIIGTFEEFTVTNSTIMRFNVDVLSTFNFTNNYLISHFPVDGESASYLEGPTENIFFENNDLINQFLIFFSADDLSVSGINGHSSSVIGFEGCVNTTISGSEEVTLLISGDSYSIHDNQLLNIGSCTFWFDITNSIIENNRISGNISLRNHTNVEVRNNYCDGALILQNSRDCIVSENTFTKQYRRGAIYDGVENVTLVNNTFLDLRLSTGEGPTESFYGFERALLLNNIFYSAHHGGYAFGANYEQDSDYNCFFGFDSVFIENNDISEHDILADPLLHGGNPFEAFLRFDSPCIDAGDPELPEDPDGTRSDIGAVFFDSRLNHAPVITSRWWTYAGNGSEFSMELNAVDENDEYEFTFQGLPEWIAVNREREEDGTIELSGDVPENQVDFVFLVEVEDEAGENDTLSVVVECLDGTLLEGNISGELGTENSPYYVVDDIIVLEDERLLIAPGIDINILAKSEFAYQRETNFIVNGGLRILGTEESPVRFNEIDFETINDYHFNLTIDTPDSAIIHSTEFALEFDKLSVNESDYFELSGSSLKSITNNSRIARIDHNQLEVIYSYADSSIITGNVVRGTDERLLAGIHVWGRYCYIAENQISNCLYDVNDPVILPAISVETDDIEIYKNLLYLVAEGIHVQSQGQTAKIESNTVANCLGTAIGLNSGGNVNVSNNLIYCARRGIHISNGIDEVSLANNLLDTRNGIDINNPPEGVGVLDRVNDNGDSTDAFNNIFSDAFVIDFGPRKYAPCQFSPAINAGSDNIPDDPDGTPPDIGFWVWDVGNGQLERFWQFPSDFDNPRSDTTTINIDPGHWQDFILHYFDNGGQAEDTVFAKWIIDDVTHSIITLDSAIDERGFIRWITEDRFQFNQAGVHKIECHATDGYYLVIDVWIVEVGNVSTGEYDFVADDFILYPAYPNPFNSRALLKYHLPVSTDVKYTIFNISGRVIANRMLPSVNSGSHFLNIDMSGYPNGTYFLQFNASDYINIEKLILAK